MHDPDHKEDEEIEDPEVDEQMDTGVRTPPQRLEDDEAAGDNPHEDEPDVLEDEMI